MKDFIRFWLPLIGYLFLIFRSSSKPVPSAVLKLNQPDYLLHAIEYAILSVLVFRALNKGLNRPVNVSNFSVAVLLSGLYGISDEYHQLFVPGRNAAYDDVLSDFIGAFLGVLFIFGYQQLKKWYGERLGS